MCKRIVRQHALFPEVCEIEGFKQQNDPQRSLVMVPFDRPNIISYWRSIETMSLSCTFSEISLIFENLKRSRDPEHILELQNLKYRSHDRDYAH